MRGDVAFPHVYHSSFIKLKVRKLKVRGAKITHQQNSPEKARMLGREGGGNPPGRGSGWVLVT